MTSPDPRLAALRAKAQAVIDADNTDARECTNETASRYALALHEFRRHAPAGEVIHLLDDLAAVEADRDEFRDAFDGANKLFTMAERERASALDALAAAEGSDSELVDYRNALALVRDRSKREHTLQEAVAAIIRERDALAARLAETVPRLSKPDGQPAEREKEDRPMTNANAPSDPDREALIELIAEGYSAQRITNGDMADAVLSVLRARGRLVEPASECDPKFGVPTDHRHFFHGPPAVTMQPEGATMGEDAKLASMTPAEWAVACLRVENERDAAIARAERAEKDANHQCRERAKEIEKRIEVEKGLEYYKSLHGNQAKTIVDAQDKLAAAQAERDRMRAGLIEVRALVDRVWHGRVGGSFAYDVIDNALGDEKPEDDRLEAWIAARQCIRELRTAIHYKEPWPKLWEILTEYDQRNHESPAPGGSSGEGL